MRIVIQRSKRGEVRVSGEVVGRIAEGLVLLIGFGKGDTEAILEKAAKKVLEMRVFSDEGGRFQHSVLSKRGEVLAVPQFTLYADTNKGRRPDFNGALDPDQASKLFSAFVSELEKLLGRSVSTGTFGAQMEVELVNDGPVTILIDVS